jgi:hypothetical protein
MATGKNLKNLSLLVILAFLSQNGYGDKFKEFVAPSYFGFLEPKWLRYKS